ncbi:putative gustatory receptor 94a [Nylanderia fulva]|uniref:putative gustatory receptor 94a n=1 Tax=Nylanderia fulva TaxID=613905 RepID=UPI0010FB9434|nr:putative gustatory receptor 94a [Nylanderia fulva]
MTVKMGLYFAFIALNFNAIFNAILSIKNYVQIEWQLLVILFIYIIMSIIKVFLINYTCERVSVKANATGNVINNVSYSISDVEIRENILQLMLQLTQSPLRLYGLGLFQFSYKFLQGFFSSIATVLVVILQAQTNK